MTTRDDNGEPGGGEDLQPWVAPEMEVRLVALALGEASEFEQAELEEAMGGDPELRLFYNRMVGADALLVDVLGAGSEASGEEWRMGEGRRGELLARLGGREEAAAEAVIDPGDDAGWGVGWKGYLGSVAAILVALLAMAGLVLPGRLGAKLGAAMPRSGAEVDTVAYSVSDPGDYGIATNEFVIPRYEDSAVVAGSRVVGEDGLRDYREQEQTVTKWFSLADGEEAPKTRAVMPATEAPASAEAPPAVVMTAPVLPAEAEAAPQSSPVRATAADAGGGDDVSRLAAITGVAQPTEDHFAYFADVDVAGAAVVAGEPASADVVNGEAQESRYWARQRGGADFSKEWGAAVAPTVTEAGVVDFDVVADADGDGAATWALNTPKPVGKPQRPSSSTRDRFGRAAGDELYAKVPGQAQGQVAGGELGGGGAGAGGAIHESESRLRWDKADAGQVQMGFAGKAIAGTGGRGGKRDEGRTSRLAAESATGGIVADGRPANTPRQAAVLGDGFGLAEEAQTRVDWVESAGAASGPAPDRTIAENLKSPPVLGALFSQRDNLELSSKLAEESAETAEAELGEVQFKAELASGRAQGVETAKQVEDASGADNQTVLNFARTPGTPRATESLESTFETVVDAPSAPAGATAAAIGTGVEGFGELAANERREEMSKDANGNRRGGQLSEERTRTRALFGAIALEGEAVEESIDGGIRGEFAQDEVATAPATATAAAEVVDLTSADAPAPPATVTSTNGATPAAAAAAAEGVTDLRTRGLTMDHFYDNALGLVPDQKARGVELDVGAWYTDDFNNDSVDEELDLYTGATLGLPAGGNRPAPVEEMASQLAQVEAKLAAVPEGEADAERDDAEKEVEKFVNRSESLNRAGTETWKDDTLLSRLDAKQEQLQQAAQPLAQEVEGLALAKLKANKSTQEIDALERYRAKAKALSKGVVKEAALADLALLSDELLLDKQSLVEEAARGRELVRGFAVEEDKRRRLLSIAADRSLETAVADEAFSTFSLHVSDVSFKLASAALLEEGRWPESGKVRVEEFVNAFDYGDPAVRLEDKVGCRTEQAAHPFLQQRNLMRVSMRTAAAGRGAGQPLRLTVLLDKSGSMEREDREAAVAKVMEALASHLTPEDVITVIGFARQPRLIADRLGGERAGELGGLVAAAPSEGGTNLESALTLGREVALRQFEDGGMNRVVLMTDGAANLGDASPDALREMVVRLRNEGVAFDACGVGADGLNDEILEALTREGDGRYYFINRAEDADEGFVRQLAGALRPAAKNVKVQVEFNPERVRGYRLLGFEKHRLNKEDFRNDTVDAAEMSAEEAGVAVYQTELIPDGQGEVGRVWVRFRDAASGEMVERSWTIPYDAGAPRLDEASESMQLAASAVLLGEKLKDGERGAYVDLDELAKFGAPLRQAYPGSKRVGQLVDMIETARGLER